MWTAPKTEDGRGLTVGGLTGGHEDVGDFLCVFVLFLSVTL